VERTPHEVLDNMSLVLCNQLMTTSGSGYVISGPDAAELAGITYRQLDYWARQGWLQPSVDRGTGRAARRLYSPTDVIRLAALAHLGRTKADVGALAPILGSLDIGEGDVLIVAGPEPSVETVPAESLRTRIASGEPFRVFDPSSLRRRLASITGGAEQEPRDERRTA
jgi:DNA-binding transcriptional MerR regulator